MQIAYAWFYLSCKQNATRKLKQSYQMRASNRLSRSSRVATTIEYYKQLKLHCKRVSYKLRALANTLCHQINNEPSWNKYTWAYKTLMGKMVLQISCLKQNSCWFHHQCDTQSWFQYPNLGKAITSLCRFKVLSWAQTHLNITVQHCNWYSSLSLLPKK